MVSRNKKIMAVESMMRSEFRVLFSELASYKGDTRRGQGRQSLAQCMRGPKHQRPYDLSRLGYFQSREAVCKLLLLGTRGMSES